MGLVTSEELGFQVYFRFTTERGSTFNNDEIAESWHALSEDDKRAWMNAATLTYNDGYSNGTADTRVNTFCGKSSGAEVCDRMMNHTGDCSWHSSIIIDNMARQVNELHTAVKSAMTMIPPGMLPPGVLTGE